MKETRKERVAKGFIPDTTFFGRRTISDLTALIAFDYILSTKPIDKEDRVKLEVAPPYEWAPKEEEESITEVYDNTITDQYWIFPSKGG